MPTVQPAGSGSGRCDKCTLIFYLKIIIKKSWTIFYKSWSRKK